METHREYVGYLDEWDGTERLTDEEIVRCKDCKWLLEDERYSEAACRFYCRTLPKEGYRDGFCAWGERRDA